MSVESPERRQIGSRTKKIFKSCYVAQLQDITSTNTFVSRLSSIAFNYSQLSFREFSLSQLFNENEKFQTSKIFPR